MIRAILRRLPAVLGILLLVTVMPTVLVLCTRWFDWPELTWPPLQSGFLGEFSPTDFQAWTVATYHEIRLSLGTDGLLLASCLLTLWATWLVMIYWLAADTLVLLRYGARRLRANGPDGVRGWITALVTSTVLVSTASPSLAAAVPANPVAASAPRHPSGPQRGLEPLRAPPEADGLGSGPSASGPMLRTHRGDSLWELANIHLGDGNRWREITDLNPHLSPEPQFLRAGDWLRLPDDAQHTEPAPLPNGVRWIIVTEGDTLSSLAHQHLGDTDRWGEIFELNRGRIQDADRTLRRPGFLMPGWRLAIPPANDAEVPDPNDATTPAPAPPPTTTPAPAHTPVPAVPSTTPGEPDSRPQPPVRVLVGVVVGLATAGTLTAAAYRWRRRRTPRTPATPLPTVYSLPVALHRTDAPPSPDNDELEPEDLDTTTARRDRQARADHTATTSAWTWELTPAAAPPPSGEPCAPHQPEQPPTDQLPIRLTVFGPPQLHWHPDAQEPAHDITLQPRMVSLLAFLALHPRGAGREQILETLWGEHAWGSNALNTALTRLRRALRDYHRPLQELVVAEDGKRYRINPELATVDYWEFATAQDTRRRAHSEHERAAAEHTIIERYTGPLADGLDAPWAEPARAYTHRAFLDAIASRAHALRETDPQRTLDMLEHAREFAPEHEPLYRDIMRLQARLGLHESIWRTVGLLHTSLAALGTRPSDDTRALAEHLRRH